MTLKEYLLKTPKGEEITVWDNTYDIEVYFYNQDETYWDTLMMELADKLNVVDITNDGVVVDMYDLIERNIADIEAADLFVSADVDDIMDDIENILAGYVSEAWLERFIDSLAM